MTMNKIITVVYKNCFYFAINNVLINAMCLCLCNNTLLTQSMDIQTQTHTYTRSNCSVTKRTERPLRNSTIKTVHLARLFENFNCTNYLVEYFFLLNFFGISFDFYLKFRGKISTSNPNSYVEMMKYFHQLMKHLMRRVQ